MQQGQITMSFKELDRLPIIKACVDKKLKEKFELENASLQEQAKFVKIADQVAHDIRSPLTALQTIANSCQSIPEKERIALREAAMAIGDIANNLLAKYQNNSESEEVRELRQPVLISAMLLQLLTEKKYQYSDASVSFSHEFNQAAYFSFIKMAPTALKRSISNVINNAVDAFDKKAGKVTLKLDANNEWVKIIVEDNGKGMPQSVIDKIMQNIAVTSGKSDGHGIGLAQVRETLEQNQGKLSIHSETGKGTQVTLTFPRIKAPAWVAEEITLGSNDLIVILDDDKSIHGAWDSRLGETLKANPNMSLKHFEQGEQALKFIQRLSAAEQKKLFLFTDYELLNQPLNGLEVVEQSKIERSILATSHYANSMIQQAVIPLGTKILPKQLAAEVSIRVEGQKAEAAVKADLVMIEDDKFLVDSMQGFFGDKVVNHYLHPDLFLNQLSKYAKETKIMLDNTFAGSDIDGLSLAKILHDQGYTQLFLFSGKDFRGEETPDYLTIILKGERLPILRKKLFPEG